ncbi:uncharacterized protein LOC116307471 [Actinia tenebrosa]|uniref:Uncharacterized protein LOC116307471 n=1 Tax=Actinia tenebrosa TaxID=6105 RepID=A0A6P8J231_ACTTE|nr:uncharacterized protein LOC116307471 [Actinia tenebrosa]
MAKSIKFHCVTCKKLEKKAEEQAKSKLPERRNNCLDISADYSAQKFMMVLRRFVAIRCYPKQIISDNGTQLVAANEELISITNSWDWDKLAEFGATEGMQWKFTPADAPWYNGVSESLISRSREH